MPLVAPFKDGQFVTSNASTNSISNSKDSGNNMDSNAFLTLLVAEMQNQDPLEPTSNTEWVSQYATFTQVSEIQSIGSNMQSMKAQDLVGEYVILKVTNNQNGESDYVSGQVDYVEYEEGKAYLNIDGKRYSIDDLDTVASKEYMEAYNLSLDVNAAYKELPKIDNLTTSYKKQINDLYDKIDGITSYQQKFFDPNVIDAIKEYKNRMDVLVAADKALKEANEKAASENAGTTVINNNTTNVTNIYNTEEAADNSEKEEEEESKAEISSDMVDALTKDNDEASDAELSENAAENGAKEE